MRILVVGCGSIGRRHAQNAAQHGDVGVVDLEVWRAKETAAAVGGRVFETLADALAWRPEAVVVATPPDHHLAVAGAAVDAGAHVLIEKPIADTDGGVDAFLDRADAHGRAVYVVCNMRFHPGPATLKRCLPEIGRPLFARAHYGHYLPQMRLGADYRGLYAARRATGGGVILDAIHEIDYLRWLFGAVRVVACQQAKLSDLDIDVEDYAAIQLVHGDDVRSEIHLDYLQRFKRRGCEIGGTEGTLVWHSDGKAREDLSVRLYRAATERWEDLAGGPVDPNAAYAAMLESFVTAITGRPTELQTGREALEALRYALGAKQSARGGHAVTLAGAPPVAAQDGVDRYGRTQDLFSRVRAVVPLASQTFSKSYQQYPERQAPLFLARGRGGRVWDVDGNEYVDLVMGLLANSLGYGDPDVDEAIRQQLGRGISFSLATELEYELSARLVDIIPCAEMVRFGKNGSDATTAAVRLARAVTGRDRIAASGYHGWQDWFIGATSRNRGVPGAVAALTHRFPYNDLAALEKIFAEHPGEFAAVVMEPMTIDEPLPGYLEAVRDLTHRHGALLVFDEVVTGFRFALGGAQELFGVTPDLAAFGKGMGNGVPIAALCGPRHLMVDLEELFFSTTFGGEALSLAASIAVIDKMRRESVVQALWQRGTQLAEAVEQLVAARGLDGVVRLRGKPPWKGLVFDDHPAARKAVVKTVFVREMLRHGVLITGSHNVCYAHSAEDFARVLAAYDRTLATLVDELARGDVESRMGGRVIEPVFRVR